MPGRGERLVLGDLDAGHLAAVEAAQCNGITGVIGNAQDMGDTDFLRFGLRGV